MSTVMERGLDEGLPIEQLVRRSDTRFQLGFAHEAAERVPPGEDFGLRTSREGLLVLARNEQALSTPVNVLRDAYGPALHIGQPRVRYLSDGCIEEPIMHVRIALNVEALGAVKRAMLVRGATPAEEYVRGRRAVLRYEAPLARLIGVPDDVANLTSGRGDVRVVLSHYAPVMGDPGGSAA